MAENEKQKPRLYPLDNLIDSATIEAEALNAIAKNKYLPRPKDLTTPKNKGGRPKKIVTE